MLMFYNFVIDKINIVIKLSELHIVEVFMTVDF
jgi:hypothetical protein